MLCGPCNAVETDACVYYIYYTPEMEVARNRGGLRTNSFFRLRTLFVDGHPAVEIDDLGDSEALLRDTRHLREIAQGVIRRSIIPHEDGWGATGKRVAKLRPRLSASSLPGILAARRTGILAARSQFEMVVVNRSTREREGCRNFASERIRQCIYAVEQ